MSDLERGRQATTLDLLNRLARALGVTLADFFSPFEGPYRPRFRKSGRDGLAAARLSADTTTLHARNRTPAGRRRPREGRWREVVVPLYSTAIAGGVTARLWEVSDLVALLVEAEN
jgi:transcriptional regulator with XRE-family HTH domain